VAFSPDGQRVFTGSQDGTAKLWMASSGRELLTLKGQKAAIIAVVFSQNGQRIFTGGADGSARVWEAAAPEQVAVSQAEEQAVLSATNTTVSLSPRAKELVPEFFCLCDHNQGKGCGLNLDSCDCLQNPGQAKMKAFIQTLVDLGKSNNQIRAAMVARYGEGVKFSK